MSTTTFSPTTIATPAAWWVSTTGTYTATSGGNLVPDATTAVMRWEDQSGNGRHLTQATSGQCPLLIQNQCNGYPVLRFDGSNDLMSVAYGFGTFPLTVFAVVKMRTQQQRLAAVFSTDVSGQGGRSIAMSYESTASPAAWYRMEVERPNAASPFNFGDQDLGSSEYYCLTGQWTGTSGSSATSAGWINERSQVSTSYTSASITAANAYVGSYNTTTSFCGGFDIAEIVVYARDFTATERAQMWKYFREKYNLVSLDPGKTEWLWPIFIGGGTGSGTLAVLQSHNGKNFQYIQSNYTVPSGYNVRDPSIYYQRSTGTWFMCYTNKGFSTTTTFDIAKSTDLISWTFVTHVDMSAVSGVQQVWGPKFVEGDAGQVYVAVSCSTVGPSTGPFVVYFIQPTATNMSTWGTPVAMGNPPSSNMIDSFFYKKAGTWRCVYKDETATAIKYSTSSSLLSGWGSPTTLSLGAVAYEGCSVVQLGDKDRLYVEAYSAATGFWYFESPDNWTTITGPFYVATGLSERNGVVIKNYRRTPPGVLQVDASNVLSTATLTYDDGTASGTATLPAVGSVLTSAGSWGAGGSGSTGTYVAVGASYVLNTQTFGAGSATTGTLTLPTVGNVYSGAGTYGVAGTGSTGTLTLPAVASVLTTAGSWGVSGSGSTGTYVAVSASSVLSGVTYGPGSSLTGTAALPATTSVDQGYVGIKRGDTSSFSITGLGDISARTKLWFTVKTPSTTDTTDAQSIVQVTESGGLIYLNGAAAGTASNASVTVDDATAGNITIVLKAVASAAIAPATYRYDIQMLTASGVSTLAVGELGVQRDVTRATS